MTPDPRDTEHIECDCVPDLGPSHCHLCSVVLGHPISWADAHPTGVVSKADVVAAKDRKKEALS